jgi:hypothetical protein
MAENFIWCEQERVFRITLLGSFSLLAHSGRATDVVPDKGNNQCVDGVL